MTPDAHDARPAAILPGGYTSLGPFEREAAGIGGEAMRRLATAGLLGDVTGVRTATVAGVETVFVGVSQLAPSRTARLIARALDGLRHDVVLVGDPPPAPRLEPTCEKDGRRWRLGARQDVAWIDAGTTAGRTVTAAVPAGYAAYAAVPNLADPVAGRAREAALVAVLAGHTAAQPWWLGYLDTGAHDVVLDDVPKVAAYTGWTYVLVEAGPEQALTWREHDPWRGTLPDLLFPADRSWLVSMLWDDDWRCIGGPATLIDHLAADPVVGARVVSVEEDLHQPGTGGSEG